MATQDQTRAPAGGKPEAEQRKPHGGLLVARRLKAHGVTKLFTLSGGHLFSIYDGCRTEGIDLVDTRHESAAAFAAEGWAKVTREPGVCALTAGPGVTNGMSALGSALQNHSPMVVLGGRAPAHALRRDRRLDGRDPRPRGRGVGGGATAALRTGLRRPAARPRVHGG